MKFFIRELFPHLKLKDPDLSLRKKITVYLSIVMQLYVVAWICLYFLLPHVAKEAYVKENTTIYLHTSYNNDLSRLDGFYAKLSQNRLFDTHAKITIHLLNNSYIYNLINPIEWLPWRQTFGITYGHTVFVDRFDLVQNKIVASSGAVEHLDAILLHESVHVLQNNRYGWLYAAFRMPYWVKEGYAIYSAQTLSLYHEEKTIIDYIKKSHDIDAKRWSPFARDQFYALMVKHAIEKMHKSVDELHEGKVSYDEVLGSLLEAYGVAKKVTTR